MDIEAIVKKHLNAWRVSTVVSPESCIRAALTELAAGYEDRIETLYWAIYQRKCNAIAMKERIRQLEAEESAHTHTLSQRDRAEDAADELAKAIAEHFRVDIGEHSNANDPWKEALCVISGEYVTDSDVDRQLAESAKRIRQLEAERGVPDGYVLAPFDPTPAMINAARWEEFRDDGDIMMTPVGDDVVAGVWSAMLAAAQQKKKEGE